MSAKQAAGLEEAVLQARDDIHRYLIHFRPTFIDHHEFNSDVIAEIIIAAVRPFCDPETLRQHGELLSICRYVNEWLRIDEPGNEAEDRAVAKVLVKAIIADCEATL